LYDASSLRRSALSHSLNLVCCMAQGSSHLRIKRNAPRKEVRVSQHVRNVAVWRGEVLVRRNRESEQKAEDNKRSECCDTRRYDARSEYMSLQRTHSCIAPSRLHSHTRTHMHTHIQTTQHPPTHAHTHVACAGITHMRLCERIHFARAFVRSYLFRRVRAGLARARARPLHSLCSPSASPSLSLQC
jgi:hypothetical protein